MNPKIVKLRSANGTAFVTIPKEIATKISPAATHIFVSLEGGRIILEPFEVPA